MRLPAGHHVLKCFFFPDDINNYTFAEAEVVLTVRCHPIIRWEHFPILRFGNPIEKQHLSAICTDCSGTFAYDPPLGHIPISGGEQNFTVIFTPTDRTVYDIAEFVLPVNIINKLQPVIQWEPKPVYFGTEFNQKNAFNAVSDQRGYWEYVGAGIHVQVTEDGQRVGALTPVLRPRGSYILQANFTPIDTYNYEMTSMVVTILVLPLQIELSYGPFPDLTYGDALRPEHFRAEIILPHREQLPSDTAYIESSTFGSFSYSHIVGTILKAGTHNLQVIYSPNDSENYIRAVLDIPLKVQRHKPLVNWKKPSSIQYSDLITDKQLCAWVSDNERDLPVDKRRIEGLITYSPLLGHRFPTVGRHKIKCTFVPEDAFNYSTVHIEYEISVRRYPVKIEWNKPEEIFEGQKLTEEQLNATHDFPNLTPADGELVYDPPLGKKLEAGEHHLLCKFVPHPNVKDNFDLRLSYAEVTLFVAPTRQGMKSRGR
jgi:hypothetical protein